MKYLTQLRLWFVRLEREIEESPLGTIGLFLGFFGLFLALLTSWSQLILWVTKYGIHVIASLLLGVGSLRLIKIIARRSEKQSLSEQAEIAFSYLNPIFDSHDVMSIDEVLNILIERGLTRESSTNAVEILLESNKLKRRADGGIILTNRRGMNK
ncbi:hypothetical protein [Pseudoalteromonas piscicida]|uniref:Uncharacterized protein n=1 Tax=Pseudoalteromonas piscicida TaxID=43662 RepID=A0AAD0RLD2_PSEO7|nr:hypothetical protein [Pseudoalteromonas piscicida]ASD69104.1 hypothetical protein B1L02_19515 [Pseudoalteromonas piscicida]AXR04531.1 hypothetical protein D0511_21795 [Pseudoalteromonas piscicida]